MPFIQVNEARIYWKRNGREDAPALVLRNSIGTDMDLCDAVLPHLRERFAIVRLDTRGHGAPIAEPGDLSLATLAKDVLAVANAAGPTRFSLVGGARERAPPARRHGRRALCGLRHRVPRRAFFRSHRGHYDAYTGRPAYPCLKHLQGWPTRSLHS